MADQNKITVEEECPYCRGTGLYVGMGERAGAAIVCSECKGTGRKVTDFVWKSFTGRKKRDDICRVCRYNPGIAVDDDPVFGGMPYVDWDAGKPFPKGSEMREYVCPAEWYQGVDDRLKPHWDECIGCGRFSDCLHFGDKAYCWRKWDRDFGPEAMKS
jgi:hypothetical protein